MKILMILVAALMPCGCSISPKEISYAEVLCKDRGGVRTLAPDLDSYHVYCRNGDSFPNVSLE